MNLLIYTPFCPSENSGGVEHVTYFLANSLKRKGWHVLLLYSLGEFKECGVECVKISKVDKLSFIKKIISDYKIDIVLVQGSTSLIDIFSSAVSNHVKLIYAHHGDPGFGYRTLNLDTTFFFLKYGNIRLKINSLIKLLLFPFLKIKKFNTLRRLYEKIYSSVNTIVLLSENSVQSFEFYLGHSTNGKIACINNPLSYNVIECRNDLSLKNKQVLFVGRLEEFTKKISLALKAWEMVMNDESLRDWKFTIVGDGQDRASLEKFVKHRNIINVEFMGFSSPTKYYEDSSVFLMTSVSEGWGLTLTESMQHGCVPIAFDSYSSVRDIITDGRNGLLIEYPNVSLFAKKLSDIMKSDKERITMAQNAILDMQKFSNEAIVDKWVNLLS